eukprot:3244295-Rhodomonas_salina.1
MASVDLSSCRQPRCHSAAALNHSGQDPSVHHMLDVASRRAVHLLVLQEKTHLGRETSAQHSLSPSFNARTLAACIVICRRGPNRNPPCSLALESQKLPTI